MLISGGPGTRARGALARLLRDAGVAAIVDIRRYPHSRRNPDVDRAAISAWAAEAGFGYRWDERIGGRRHLPADSEPEDTWWQVDAFAAYAAYTRTPTFAAALRELVDQAARAPTAMMCSESVWWRCHRRIVADVAVLTSPIPVRHLMHDGRLVPHAPSAGARLGDDGRVVWLSAR
nr:MAG: hypothetical protein DIU75_24550 [Mycolicibacterium hassiacum]